MLFYLQYLKKAVCIKPKYIITLDYIGQLVRSCLLLSYYIYPTTTGKSTAISRIHSVNLVTPGNLEETTNNVYSKLELDFSHRELMNLNQASSEIHRSLTGMTQLIRAHPQIQLDKIPGNPTEIE